LVQARHDLTMLRDEIVRVDDAILALLARRQELACQVGDAKRLAGAPIADPAREAAVIRRIAERARALQLPADAARELFRRIIAMAREVQRPHSRGDRAGPASLPHDQP
jgi:chorismate mutase/prephenate dehydratase